MSNKSKAIEIEVRPIGQYNTKTCWIACYRMLYAWRGIADAECYRRLKASKIPMDEGLDISQWRKATYHMKLSGYDVQVASRQLRQAGMGAQALRPAVVRRRLPQPRPARDPRDRRLPGLGTDPDHRPLGSPQGLHDAPPRLQLVVRLHQAGAVRVSALVVRGRAMALKRRSVNRTFYWDVAYGTGFGAVLSPQVFLAAIERQKSRKRPFLGPPNLLSSTPPVPLWRWARSAGTSARTSPRSRRGGLHRGELAIAGICRGDVHEWHLVFLSRL